MRVFILGMALSVSAWAGERHIPKWGPFLDALAEVESTSGTDMINEDEDAQGWYQMRPLARKDANDILGTKYRGKDLHNRRIANQMYMAYIWRYRSRWQTVGDLIHLWHLGPDWRNRLDLDCGYQARVLQAYRRRR